MFSEQRKLNANLNLNQQEEVKNRIEQLKRKHKKLSDNIATKKIIISERKKEIHNFLPASSSNNRANENRIERLIKENFNDLEEHKLLVDEIENIKYQLDENHKILKNLEILLNNI